MPDAFQSVAAGAYNHWAALLSFGAVMKSGRIVTQWLQAIQQVINVLNFGNGSQATHGQANTLSHNGEFPDAGIKNAINTIFCLQAREALVHIADIPQV